MTHSNPRRWLRAQCGIAVLAAAIWPAATRPLEAQVVVVRTPVVTPATAFSSVIFAQAAYLRAQGDFLVSAGRARILHAEAASKEMDNAVKWVNTYFERRRLNREARDAEHIDFLEHQRKDQENQRKKIEETLDVVVGGDVTDELNWMLRQLSAQTSYSTFLTRSVLESADNAPLSEDERGLILVKEATVAGGKARTFAVDTADELATDLWPVVLRDERFDAARGEFESARDAIKRKFVRDNETRLMKAVDQLADDLTHAYPRARRKKMVPDEFFAYRSAQQYVQSLAVGAYRLIETRRLLASDESIFFNGQSVGELLQHMLGKQLQFAKPGPGAETLYRKIFHSVRKYYLELVPNG